MDPAATPAEEGIDAFLEHGGRARLADFGLARSLTRGRLDLSLTAPQHPVGTVDYIAPECRAGKQATQRSDLYAAGVMLYEMLTGKRPVGHFALPSKTSDAPAAVDRIVLRCLAADPAERYADALSLKRDLQRVVKGGGMRRVLLLAGVGLVAAVVLVIQPWRAAQKTSANALTRPHSPMAAAGATTIPTTEGTSPATMPAAGPKAQPEEPAAQAPAPTPMIPDAGPKADEAIGGPGIAVEVPKGPLGWRGPMMPFVGPPAGMSKPDAWGPEYTITILVEGAKDWQIDEVTRQLKAMIKSGSWSTSHSGDVVKVTVSPFADLDAFVGEIGFASVISIDREKRIVRMRCTLPTTKPAVEIQPMSAKEVGELADSSLVLVKQGDAWVEATVLVREGRRVKVHYDGDTNKPDEWVGLGRLAWRQ